MAIYLGEDAVNMFCGQPTGGAVINNQDKSVTPTESQQSVTADSGYTGLGTVTVGAIDSEYIGSDVPQKSSSDLTASGATVTAPSGYYASSASKSVASGTAGTPTASKGTVSNHAITVTPSVTNTAGYISGGTKTGTGVSVSASEVVSGTYSVTSSGNKDVTNYATASVPSGTAGTPTATKGTVSNHSVSVTPSVTNTTGFITGSTKTGTAVTVSASELVSGSETKTQNGTYDVTNLASLIVNVAGGGGGGLEYETGTYTPEADIARPTITFANSHTEAPVFVLFSDMTGTAHSTTNSCYNFMFCDFYKLWGHGIPYSSSGFRYACAYYSYRSSSTSSISSSGYICSYTSDSTTSSSASYPRYWASPTNFHPYTNSTSRYWRTGRTFEWIAVWKA